MTMAVANPLDAIENTGGDGGETGDNSGEATGANGAVNSTEPLTALVGDGKKFKTAEELADYVSKTDQKFGSLGTKLDQLARKNEELVGKLRSVEEKTNPKPDASTAREAANKQFKEMWEKDPSGLLANLISQGLGQANAPLYEEQRKTTMNSAMKTIAGLPGYSENEDAIREEFLAHPEIYQTPEDLPRAYGVVMADKMPTLAESLRAEGAKAERERMAREGFAITEDPDGVRSIREEEKDLSPSDKMMRRLQVHSSKNPLDDI